MILAKQVVKKRANRQTSSNQQGPIAVMTMQPVIFMKMRRQGGSCFMTSTGKLWGVVVGPGDPELLTVKAARVIGEADVVAFHSARHGRSISRALAAGYMRDGQRSRGVGYSEEWLRRVVKEQGRQLALPKAPGAGEGDR